ncbi:MAG: response regulator [Alphaproteobacteria bacterium]|nr:response regulator [Alphaproteobacteria bacterium]
MARIVVIDDDPISCKLAATPLQQDGHTVDSFTEPQAGLRATLEHPPALLVTDLIMPGPDGIEIIKAVKRSHPEVKIVAMSGGGSAGKDLYLRMARKLGADAIIRKPLDQGEYAEAVSKCLA